MLFLSILTKLAFAETYVSIVGDVYGKYDMNQPEVEESTNPYHPFDYRNGFAVSWFGTDLSIASDSFGAKFDLRFGPTAILYNGLDASIDGVGMMTNVKQGYLTYTPFEKLTIDFGKFDTIYGAEVADAHNNMNYTRASINWMVQPFTHTGLRVSTHIGGVQLIGMVVNGWNNAFDNNNMKSFGVQASMGPLIVGYIGGPEQAHNADDWRHFVDAIFRYDIKKFHMVLNGSYGLESFGSTTQEWYGASGIIGYDISELLAINMRGEYILDPNGWMTGTRENTVATGTLTFLHALSKEYHFFGDIRYDKTTIAAYPSKNGYKTSSLSAIVGVTISKSIVHQ